MTPPDQNKTIVDIEDEVRPINPNGGKHNGKGGVGQNPPIAQHHVSWTAVILGSAALAGAWVLTVPILGMMLMASDSCRSRNDKPICDPRNQTLVLVLPTAAMVAGVLLIAIAGGIAVRHGRKTVHWQIVAWLLLLTAWIASCTILTAG
ncbi:hypothetical protein [Actinokineospora xionganensis]|uniref:DUF4190 domain-containing protein n=1 Tax=Actinokineospora xionganensis TaxID=2684470 RepID=A0ABR7L627_9PSEU|nr:hypothetical protein [Actinokineospora xionganensis]MBC6448150.1 hypothetical protein [Actinokineospora xionganensis]